MMKLSIVIALLAVVLPSMAQDSLSFVKYRQKPKVSAFEFLVGPSFVSIRGDHPYARFEDRIGYSAGVGVMHSLSRKFEIRARLLWERKGYEEIQVGYSTNVNKDYITASLVPQLVLGKLRKFNIGAGTYFGSLQKSVASTQFSSSPPVISSSTAGSNQFDFGLIFNLGYSIPLKKKLAFTLQFTHNYGLRPIWNWSNSLFPPLYNSAYSLMAGFTFANSNH